MKLIKPNLEILEQQPGLDGIYKQIELAGRTCYESSPLHRWYSEDKTRWINENSEEWKLLNNPKNEYPIKGENISAKGFVERMIKSGHCAMLEHGTVYLKIENYEDIKEVKYKLNPYSKVECVYPNILYVTTNFRVLVENDWLDDLQYICEPTEHHEKRITVKWTCDRVTGESFLRHRVFSFARESTRYCNYSKDKFDNEITFIIPTWLDIKEGRYGSLGWNQELGDNIVYNQEENISLDTDKYLFFDSLENAEHNYMKLLACGWKPQQARQVLPFSVYSPLVMTGFESDWKHFFSLRSSKAGATGVHPDAAYLADMLYDKFYIEKDVNFTLIFCEAFDGNSKILKDGDMITYHTTYDRNKDMYNTEKVTITPKNGDKYTLTYEEYTKLCEQNNQNHISQSLRIEVLNLGNPSTLKTLKKRKEEVENDFELYKAVDKNSNTVYYMSKDEYDKNKEFQEKKEEEFGSNLLNNN